MRCDANLVLDLTRWPIFAPISEHLSTKWTVYAVSRYWGFLLRFGARSTVVLDHQVRALALYYQKSESKNAFSQSGPDDKIGHGAYNRDNLQASYSYWRGKVLYCVYLSNSKRVVVIMYRKSGRNVASNTTYSWGDGIQVWMQGNRTRNKWATYRRGYQRTLVWS